MVEFSLCVQIIGDDYRVIIGRESEEGAASYQLGNQSLSRVFCLASFLSCRRASASHFLLLLLSINSSSLRPVCRRCKGHCGRFFSPHSPCRKTRVLGSRSSMMTQKVMVPLSAWLWLLPPHLPHRFMIAYKQERKQQFFFFLLFLSEVCLLRLLVLFCLLDVDNSIAQNRRDNMGPIHSQTSFKSFSTSHSPGVL